MPYDWQKLAQQLTTTVSYVLIGLLFFAAAFWIIARVSPFSLRKEIEEDQNTSLGIILASVFIGIAIIIAAAIHGS